MLTEILDQWDVLVELQRQQNTWQQRWDRAQAEFQHALQQLDPHDADRLARVLAESLPTPLPMTSHTPTNSPVGSLSDNAQAAARAAPPATQPRPSATQYPAEPATDPTAAPQQSAAPQTAAPQTAAQQTDPTVVDLASAAQAAPTPTTAPAPTTTGQPTAVDTRRTVQSPTQSSTQSSTESPTDSLDPIPNAAAGKLSELTAVTAEPMIDEAAIFASDDVFFGSHAPDDSPSLPLSKDQAQAATAPSATEPTPAQLELLQWATDMIGDGVTENELFQAMRKSPFAGQARQLFELLRERDAFYETADEVIHVHSLRKSEEFQNT